MPWALVPHPNFHSFSFFSLNRWLLDSAQEKISGINVQMIGYRPQWASLKFQKPQKWPCPPAENYDDALVVLRTVDGTADFSFRSDVHDVIILEHTCTPGRFWGFSGVSKKALMHR